MSSCEGCGYVFATGAETFGGIGQAFCFDCWQTEQEIVVRREPLIRERSDLEVEIAHIVEEIRAIESPAYFAQEYGAMQKSTVIMDLDLRGEAAMERLGDVNEELECLTVEYQRRHSVIGRAA